MSLKKVFIEEKLGHPQQICHFRKFRIIVFIDNILRKSEQPAFIRFTGLGTNGAAGFRRNVSQIFGCAGSGTFAEIQAYTKEIKKIKFKVRIMPLLPRKRTAVGLRSSARKESIFSSIRA